MVLVQMPGEYRARRQRQRVDLFADVRLIRALSGQHELERDAAIHDKLCGLQNVQNVLLPVQLAAIEEHGRFIGQAKALLGGGQILRARLVVRRAVRNDDDIACIAVFTQCFCGVLAHRPDLIAFFIEGYDKLDAEICQRLSLHELIEIVIVFGMKCADERDIALLCQTQRLLTGDKGAVRMHDVERDHRHARIVMRVKHRDTRLVLLLQRQIARIKIHQFKRIAAPVAGVRHRRNHIAFMPGFCNAVCIAVDNASNAVDDREKGVG